MVNAKIESPGGTTSFHISDAESIRFSAASPMTSTPSKVSASTRTGNGVDLFVTAEDTLQGSVAWIIVE